MAMLESAITPSVPVECSVTPRQYTMAAASAAAYILAAETRSARSMPAHGLHALGRVVPHGRGQYLEAFGALAHEILVVQAVLDEVVHHAVRERHVRAGAQLQMDVGLRRQPDVARVHHDEPAPPLDRGAQLHADDGMRLFGFDPTSMTRSACRVMSSMEFVMAPEPSMVARPATVGACQTRAQQSTLFVCNASRAIFWNR